MGDTNRLSTLANGLRVVEQLAQGGRSMRELAAAVGLPRQTTYRIVATLMDHGWVDRLGDTYRVSPRLRSLAAESPSPEGLRDALAVPAQEAPPVSTT